jgi:hypothetical protein
VGCFGDCGHGETPLDCCGWSLVEVVRRRCRDAGIECITRANNAPSMRELTA